MSVGQAKSEPTPKPSILEIAAMPYPASEQAMRKHYDPHWRKYSNGDLAKFTVEIEYSTRTRKFWECEVEAADEEEAERIASDLFDKADLDCEYDEEFEDICNTKVARAA